MLFDQEPIGSPRCKRGHEGCTNPYPKHYSAEELMEAVPRSTMPVVARITTDTTHIGMLRQWLNEDRITDPKKMVTNDDIIHFLTFGDKVKE